MNFIDTTPELRLLDNGKIGYFYSLQQLEAIRDKRMADMTVEQVYASFKLAKALVTVPSKMGSK